MTKLQQIFCLLDTHVEAQKRFDKCLNKPIYSPKWREEYENTRVVLDECESRINALRSN